MRALAEFYKALGQCNSISPIVFIIYSTGSPSDHVTGLAMWRGLANSTQRKSKGKAHPKKNPNPPLLLLGRFRSNGLMIDQKRH